jgi:DNA-binding MarR family transcriptional regulator
MPDLPRLFSELIRFEIELWNAIDARLRAAYDLPLTWFEPMQVIARCGACRVNDIATELSITIGGTSKLVDRIEAAGYCWRRSNPDDRRSSLIELTPAGRRLLADATAVFEKELQLRLGSVLSPEALEFFSRTLSMLRAAGRTISTTEKAPQPSNTMAAGGPDAPSPPSASGPRDQTTTTSSRV